MMWRSLLMLPPIALAGWLSAAPAAATEPLRPAPGSLQLTGWFDDLFSNAPSGSYRSSCRDEQVKNNILHAECERRNGKYRDTSLDLRGCSGDIINDDGRLACRKTAQDRTREENGGGPFAGKD